ncbi:LysM peptidoglycan-binding domain-containing protein [Paenibacillus chartarius]|uniref:LysM peptidoglycan-binding domain-containing protein n=1 Tax=Paenibacillus chartarius TaxID=747481 RepID=A0ABV6DIU3_9BACL
MKIHIVKLGETLVQLAAKYGVELAKLIAANPHILNPDKIETGMKIKVPTAPKPLEPAEGTYAFKHVVKQGDTLWKLSKAWEVTLQELIAANPHLKNPNVLLTGEVVYIPKKNHSPAAPIEGGAPETDNLNPDEHPFTPIGEPPGASGEATQPDGVVTEPQMQAPAAGDAAPGLHTGDVTPGLHTGDISPGLYTGDIVPGLHTGDSAPGLHAGIPPQPQEWQGVPEGAPPQEWQGMPADMPHMQQPFTGPGAEAGAPSDWWSYEPLMPHGQAAQAGAYAQAQYGMHFPQHPQAQFPLPGHPQAQFPLPGHPQAPMLPQAPLMAEPFAGLQGWEQPQVVHPFAQANVPAVEAFDQAQPEFPSMPQQPFEQFAAPYGMYPPHGSAFPHTYHEALATPYTYGSGFADPHAPAHAYAHALAHDHANAHAHAHVHSHAYAPANPFSCCSGPKMALPYAAEGAMPYTAPLMAPYVTAAPMPSELMPPEHLYAPYPAHGAELPVYPTDAPGGQYELEGLKIDEKEAELDVTIDAPKPRGKTKSLPVAPASVRRTKPLSDREKLSVYLRSLRQNAPAKSRRQPNLPWINV